MTVTLTTATADMRWHGEMTRLDGDGNVNVLQVTLTGLGDSVRVGCDSIAMQSYRDQWMAIKVDTTAPDPNTIDWTAARICPRTGGGIRFPVSHGNVISLRFLYGADSTQLVTIDAVS